MGVLMFANFPWWKDIGADYIPTEEERRVFAECSDESFWFRCKLNFLINKIWPLVPEIIMISHRKNGQTFGISVIIGKRVWLRK